MTLRGDDRAVVVQIGAVILLGFLVISLSLYQATVVPDENRQVEFQHNQRVQSDMLEVRNAILGTAATGSASPATVELGTQYPTRTVAINPSPPSGTLSTSPLGQISIRNATADDAATTEPDYPETADFWNGTTRNYTTKSLEYRPSYANYDNAPTTVYENGLVYNRFRSGNLTRSGQPVVAGTRISLVALSGNLSRGGASGLLVDPEAMSVSTRTISVTNNSTGENVSVVIPSELDADEWRDLLNETGDYDDDPGTPDGAYVYDVTDEPADGVKLYFEPGTTYQLKLSKVGVGQGAEDTKAAYLTSVEDLTSDPFTDRNYSFAVEVRDKYNNPTPTTAERAAKRGNVSTGTVVEPGRFRYQYRAPTSSGIDIVNITYNTEAGDAVYNTGNASFDGRLVENVQYNLSVQAGGSGGGGGGGNAADQVQYDTGTGDTGNKDSVVTFGIENTGGSDVTITGIAVNSTTDTSATWISGTGNTDGEVSVDGNTVVAGSFQVGDNRQGFNPFVNVIGGGTATFEIDRFKDGNESNDDGVSMSGDSITVTLFFNDNSQRTYTIGVP